MRTELYFAIINIVDFLALSDIDRENASELYRILDKLLRIDAEYSEEDINDTFEAIADANDVGGVRSWQEMVGEFEEMFRTGERVTVGV